MGVVENWVNVGKYSSPIRRVWATFVHDLRGGFAQGEWRRGPNRTPLITM